MHVQYILALDTRPNNKLYTLGTTVCVEIFEVYKLLWISWYAFYQQKLIHNN